MAKKKKGRLYLRLPSGEQVDTTADDLRNPTPELSGQMDLLRAGLANQKTVPRNYGQAARSGDYGTLKGFETSDQSSITNTSQATPFLFIDDGLILARATSISSS